MKVIKKDGTIEQFDGQKIVNAVSKLKGWGYYGKSSCG